MAYLDKDKGGKMPRAQPRKRHVEYHIRRESAEGFRKPFVVPTPAWEYIKYVTSYPMRFEHFYYQSISEYVERMIAAMRDLAESRGWSVVHRINMVAREVALAKDAPLISAEFYPDKAMLREILATYPINKVLLFAEIAHNKKLHVTWGHMKKSAIEAMLNTKPLRWHEHQAVKYRNHFRDLLRMVHPKPATPELEAVWGWVVGKRSAPTPYIEAYERVEALAKSGRYTEAVDLAIEYRLPWEVVRSRVGHLDEVAPSTLEDAARRIMTSIDVVMQFSTLKQALGRDRAMSVLRSRLPGVPTPYLSRFAVNMAKLGDYEASRTALEEIARRGSKVLSEFGSVMGSDMAGRTVVLVDVSESMSGQGIERAAMVLAGILPVVRRVYVFNSSIGVEPFDLPTDSPTSPSWILRLLNMPSSGTPLLDSIKYVLHTHMSSGETLIVLTDEQENASEATSEDVAAEVARRGVNMVVVALNAYPTDFVPKRPLANIVGVAGNDVTAFSMGLRLMDMLKAQSEGISDEEFLEMMRRMSGVAAEEGREPSIA